MLVVVLEDPADTRYRRCLANGFVLSKEYVKVRQFVATEVEEYTKDDGKADRQEIDFGDLEELEDE